MPRLSVELKLDNYTNFSERRNNLGRKECVSSQYKEKWMENNKWWADCYYIYLGEQNSYVRVLCVCVCIGRVLRDRTEERVAVCNRCLEKPASEVGVAAAWNVAGTVLFTDHRRVKNREVWKWEELERKFRKTAEAWKVSRSFDDCHSTPRQWGPRHDLNQNKMAEETGSPLTISLFLPQFLYVPPLHPKH